MTHLIVTHEDNDVDEFRFDADHSPILLGRRTSNDVCITSPSVSGSHARITLDADGAWIEDLNSTNGTFINGRLISRRRLEHGDDIAIGKARVTWLGCAGGQASVSTLDFSAAASAAASAAVMTPDGAPESAYGSSSETSPASGAERTPGSTIDSEAAGESPAPRRRFDDLFDTDDEVVIVECTDEGNRPVTPSHHESSDNLDTAVAARPVTASPCTAAPPTRPGSQTAAISSTPVVADPVTSAPAEPSVSTFAAQPTAVEEHPLDDVQDVTLGDTTSDDALFEVSLGKAALEIRNGAKSGQTLTIDKPVTTLGRPGIQIAAIMRKPDGYFLMHVESDENTDRPTLNDDAIGDDPVPLRSGDELRVAGVDVQFTLLS